ncbi:hypothetical protein [Nitrospina gracilis]|uniref:hypothetical protein n=1 Tax=Nitrospina gracilis TaxID=35801 RepID=UPI001F44B920|nr:hypothetical protein [Nitrospina gracilis]MCF8721773.1 hypothetical protein [Nitrospina gracilis Nb-211]
MGIGQITLTTNLKPNLFTIRNGVRIKPDNLGNKFYKNFAQLELAQVFWEPHKFGFFGNLTIPHTKINFNAQRFKNFYSLREYLFPLIKGFAKPELQEFHISRIEIHSDIEALPLDTVLARLWVMGYRRESVSFYKGNSIYIGSNPKIRIFNKTQQIKRKALKGKQISELEKEILNSNKSITRFSIEIRNYKGTLYDITKSPKQLTSYFDRFKFYNFEEIEPINRMGGFQILMSKIRREHRKSLAQFKDKDLEKLIRKNFLDSLLPWFKEPKKEDIFSQIDKEFKKAVKEIEKIIED